MIKALYPYIVIFLMCAFTGSAQDLTITGYTKYDGDALEAANIKVMVGDKVFTQTTSDKTGFFSVKLDYNQNYSIYLQKEGYCTMFAVVDGSIPENKEHYRIKYEITVPFYLSADKSINSKAFEQPFTKISFDGKSKFVDDVPYITAFYQVLGTIPEEKPVVKEQPKKPVEKKINIAGRFLHDDDFGTPYALARVDLKDSSGKIIMSTQTNHFGVFAFSGITASQIKSVEVNTNVQGTVNDKIVLTTLSKINVGDPKALLEKKLNLASFDNTKENRLVEKLENKDYHPFVSGKLIIDTGNDKKIFANKTVCLYSDKNELLERTKTNMFGGFLFSKLNTDQNFYIAVDEQDLGEGLSLKLFNSKDKEINKAVLFDHKKYSFNFLSGDVASYDPLLVEDSDLRMNLEGKIVNDNENNPVTHLHIAILDDEYHTLVSTETNNKGEFIFRYLPVSSSLFLKILDESDIVGMNNLILYDKKGNLIKYISIKPNVHEYRLLPKEIYAIQELYIDDPWLNLSSKDFKKPASDKMVIIENVYFESNSAELLPEAKQTLDKAIVAMQNNPNMKIDISAHSDSKGSDEHNLKLSEKRAESAMQYFISKGITKERITAKGYGETKLLNKCGNNVPCPEEEHAKNRRLEFSIRLN